MIKKLHELKNKCLSSPEEWSQLRQKTPEKLKRPFANVECDTNVKIKQPTEISPVKSDNGEENQSIQADSTSCNGIIDKPVLKESFEGNSDQAKRSLEKMKDFTQSDTSEETVKGIRSESPPMKKKKPGGGDVGDHRKISGKC